MAVPIYTIPKEESGLATGIGQGLGSILQGLASRKVKEMQGRQFEKMGLPSALAYLDPQVQSSALKQIFAAQQLGQPQPQIQEALAKLRELEEGGEIGERSMFNPVRWTEGKKTPETDLAKMTAGQLRKLLPKGEYVPADYHKMDPEARAEYLAQLEQKYGAQQQPMSVPQQESLQAQQQMAQQQPGGEGLQGPLGSVLRTLGGAAMQAPAAIASKIPRIGGPASGAIIGSDLLRAGDPEHSYEATPEQLAQLTPDQREYREAIERDTREKGSPTDYLPTTDNIKKLVGKVIPDNIITPRSKEEKIIADSVAKFVNLKTLGNMGFAKALAGTVTGMAGRKIAEAKKWSPLAANTTEFLFTMAPGLLWNAARAQVKDTSSELYNKFNDSAAARQQMDVKDIYEKSKQLRNEANKFKSLGSNKQLISSLEDFELQAADGKMKFADAVHAKRELYRIIEETPFDTTAAGKLMDFTGDLRDAILDQGVKLDPDLGFNFLKKADEIRTGLANSKTIVESLRDSAKKGSPKGVYLRTMLSKYPEATMAGVAGQAVGLPFARGALPVAMAQEVAQMYKFFTKTPGAWEELAKIALDELQGNSRSAAARLGALDKKAIKAEKKQSRFLTRR